LIEGRRLAAMKPSFLINLARGPIAEAGGAMLDI
jgi:phosphoglycerate dehydrogenase-like enzyme